MKFDLRHRLQVTLGHGLFIGRKPNLTDMKPVRDRNEFGRETPKIGILKSQIFFFFVTNVFTHSPKDVQYNARPKFKAWKFRRKHSTFVIQYDNIL